MTVELWFGIVRSSNRGTRAQPLRMNIGMLSDRQIKLPTWTARAFALFLMGSLLYSIICEQSHAAYYYGSFIYKDL
jgi:hypothetical protein